jgi:hypothetical protein
MVIFIQGLVKDHRVTMGTERNDWFPNHHPSNFVKRTHPLRTTERAPSKEGGAG